MLPPLQIQFLRDKIQTLRTARFVNLSDAVLKLPSNVIETITVDDAGQIWFFISQPWQHLSEFENGFPASLNFYRKGMRFRLSVHGKACMISDPEEIYGLKSVIPEVSEMSQEGLVLIKLKMQVVDYYEWKNRREPGLLDRLANYAKRWVLNQREGYQRRFRFDPESMVGFGS